jgi:uncharacterized protein with PQ loop repeat
MFHFVGWMALAITVVYTCLGLPAQITENRRKQSVEGLSLCMTVLLTLTFSSWVLYGVLKSDWYIVVSNFPGVVCAAIMLVQFRRYRKS